MSTADLQSVLDAVEARVSYMRASTEAPPDDGWIPCVDLLSGGPLLADLIASTGEGRGTHDAQVAASLFAQAYAFRVAGVTLAAHALGLEVPSIRPEAMAVRIARHRPAAVAHLDPAPRAGEVEALLDELFTSHLVPLIAAVRGGVRIGERLLWGNVAASCAVAFRAVEGVSTDDQAVVRERGEQFFVAAEPWLKGLGEYITLRGAARDGWFWERTNCCLWYQAAADGGKCDDCSLLEPAERRGAWQQQIDEVPA